MHYQRLQKALENASLLYVPIHQPVKPFHSSLLALGFLVFLNEKEQHNLDPFQMFWINQFQLHPRSFPGIYAP